MIKFKLFGFTDNEGTSPARTQEAATPDDSTRTDGVGTPAVGKRVLIVDDEVIFLKITAGILQSAGFHVRTAREGSAAIAALGDQPVDSVLMDIEFAPDVCNGGMGSWDGFQIMSWLRGNPAARGVRFIMVSVSDSPAHHQRAKQLGAVAYLHKPLDANQLLATLNVGN